MNHYVSIQEKINIAAKPWCIVGTGPSMTKLTNPQIYNIWAINLAIRHTKQAEVLSLFDAPIFKEINPLEYSYQALLTRTTCINLVTGLPNVYFVEYREDVSAIGTQYFKIPPSTLTNSAAMAINILGHFNVKKIFLAGVDGGCGRHEVFNESPTSVADHNYDRHWNGCLYWAAHWKIELVKL